MLVGAAASALASPVVVDATALTAPQVSVVGFGYYSNAGARTFDLAPGSYTFLAPSSPADVAVGFTVGAGGTVGYAPGLDVGAGGFLTGAGTTTLTVLGFAVTIDPSALTGTYLYVSQETQDLPHAPVTVHLLPATTSSGTTAGSATTSSASRARARWSYAMRRRRRGAQGAGTGTLAVRNRTSPWRSCGLLEPQLFLEQETPAQPVSEILFATLLPGAFQAGGGRRPRPRSTPRPAPGASRWPRP